jgi:hypothetical protein
LQRDSSPSHSGQPNYWALYIVVGFVGFFLAAYALTIAFGGVPIWIAPDTLGPRLISDMATRWQSWVGGLFGAWFGYKVGKA